MSTKRSISFFVIFLQVIFLSAQTTKFEVVIGGSGYDYGYSVTQTFDRGYVVAGATSSFGSGGTDAYLVKVDSTGVLNLHRTYGGINIDQAYSVNETSDSGLVIAGYTNSFGHGGYDMYLIKTNSSGDTVWTKTYGGSNWDFAYSAQQTSDGGYIIAGGSYSFGNGNEDIFVVKTNSIGDTAWTRSYGGANDDEARCIKQTSDGGYILTGFTKSFGDPNGDIYTIKLDTAGDTVWTYRFGNAQPDASYDIVECPNKYIIAGKTKSIGAGNYDGIALEIDLNGSYIYAGAYGGTAEDGMNSVAYSPGGRMAVLGYTYSYGGGFGTNDYVLYIQNPVTGFHSATYGGLKMDQGYNIRNTHDGGYIICGTSTSYSNLDHIYLIKADSNGTSTANVINVVAGISKLSGDKNLIVYPNPASNELRIAGLASDETTIIVNDILGKTLVQKRTDLEEYILDTSFLMNGIYFITAESEHARSTHRIIIQH